MTAALFDVRDLNRCPWDCGCYDVRVFGHAEPCPLAARQRPMPVKP